MRGGNQVLDDLRVLAGPVKGLLDGEHMRIAGGMLQDVEHVVETLVGVMKKNIPATDAAERVILIERGASLLEVRKLQVGAFRHVIDLNHAVEIDRPVDPRYCIYGQIEVFQEHLDDPIRTVLGNLQSDCGVVPA